MKFLSTTIDEAVNLSLSTQSESIEFLINGQMDVAQMMKELQSPPDEFKGAYERMVSLYGNFDTLISLAAEPSGSLFSFTEKVNDLQGEMMRQIREIEVMIL